MKLQMKMKSEPCRSYKYWLTVLVLWHSGVIQREAGVLIVDADCIPSTGCKALAYYRLQQGDNLEILQGRFQTNNSEVQAYNPELTDPNSILAGANIYLPFDCYCLNGNLTHRFAYSVATGDTVERIVNVTYQKLTTVEDVTLASNLGSLNSIYASQTLSVPVRCYCGDPSLDPKYGLFSTYVVQSSDQLTTLATKFGVDADIILKFNPGIGNLSPGSIIFIPSKAGNGSFPPFLGSSGGGSSGSSVGIIVGVIVGGVVLAALLLFALIFGLKCYRRRKLARKFAMQESALLPSSSMAGSKPSRSASTMLTELKSVEFTYEELAAATDNFSMMKKIGQGGFASVYLGFIRDQKLAIKKMNLQATKEFLAELQVLTNVHHTNLVQLIGYCTTNSLFLVYEYIENGTLDHHLRRRKSDDNPPLSWLQRVQISLDAARGLEYIHEHTKPTYIHRDIKSANILIDNNFRAKVADFGLAKLAEEGIGTGIVGTFGYMPPEYALYAEVSPKLDVYAFGVVLFEIISGRVAISAALPSENDQQSPAQNRESRTLPSLFEPILNDPDGKTLLPKCIDPALNDEYPIDAVWKMAQLARRCTHQSPDMRPTMRFAVVQLMTLASATQEWDFSYFSRDSSLSRSPLGDDQL